MVRYLAKPTGKYSIGYIDYHLIDTNRSMDMFSSKQVQNHISNKNSTPNREIMTRIYYPTGGTIKLGDSYYKPQTEALKKLILLDQNVTKDMLSEVDSIQSYSHKNSSISVAQKFPVVFFSHGMSQCVQSYENVITNLVSHGYIVVGINSLFIGSNIELPNGNIVNIVQHEHGGKNLDVLMDNLLPIQMDDIIYVINQMQELQKQNRNIFSSMDLQNIAGIGHSLGGTAIANLARANPKLFKAAVGFDSEMNQYTQIIEPFATPFLHQISGSRYIRIPWHDKPFKPVFRLGKDNYLVGIAPNKAILMREFPPFYSLHSEFGDISSIKKFKIFQDANANIEKEHGYPLFGYGNSDHIINSINIPLVKFLDIYLKNQPDSFFETNNNSPLKENLVLVTYPATF